MLCCRYVACATIFGAFSLQPSRIYPTQFLLNFYSRSRNCKEDNGGLKPYGHFFARKSIIRVLQSSIIWYVLSMTYQTFSLPLLNSYSENMILQAEQATQYPILNFSIIASFSLLDYQRLIAKVQVPILNHFGPTHVA